jgi:hypothetical protein
MGKAAKIGRPVKVIKVSNCMDTVCEFARASLERKYRLHLHKGAVPAEGKAIEVNIGFKFPDYVLVNNNSVTILIKNFMREMLKKIKRTNGESPDLVFMPIGKPDGIVQCLVGKEPVVIRLIRYYHKTRCNYWAKLSCIILVVKAEQEARMAVSKKVAKDKEVKQKHEDEAETDAEMDVVTIHEEDHDEIVERIKEALVATGHVSEDVSGSVAQAALSAVVGKDIIHRTDDYAKRPSSE